MTKYEILKEKVLEMVNNGLIESDLAQSAISEAETTGTDRELTMTEIMTAAMLSDVSPKNKGE